MKTTTQYYVTGKMDIAIELMTKGFKVVDTRLDGKTGRFVVFIFERTEEFRNAVKEIKENKQKSIM